MSSELAPIDEAPRQVQALAEALTDVDCCAPTIAGVRSFVPFGNDMIHEVEIVHELTTERDGRLYPHGRRTIVRIASYG